MTTTNDLVVLMDRARHGWGDARARRVYRKLVDARANLTDVIRHVNAGVPDDLGGAERRLRYAERAAMKYLGLGTRVSKIVTVRGSHRARSHYRGLPDRGWNGHY